MKCYYLHGHPWAATSELRLDLDPAKVDLGRLEATISQPSRHEDEPLSQKRGLCTRAEPSKRPCGNGRKTPSGESSRSPAGWASTWTCKTAVGTRTAGRSASSRRASSRDTIEFKPYKTTRIRRKLGDIRPVGELKNELAVADESGPSDFDTVETLEWAVGTNRSIVDTDSMTHGWSVTVTQGYEIGGDAAGGKYVGGIELGAHGDYSKETAKGLESSVGATKSTQVELPAGQIARIVQTVQSGEVEVDVEDFIVLELGWRVRDWKVPNNTLLKNHSGFGGKERSKSRWHWDCLDAYDLLTLGEGTNPRYPGARGQRLIDRKDIGDDIAVVA